MAGTHAVRLHGEEIDFGNLDGLAGHWVQAYYLWLFVRFGKGELDILKILQLIEYFQAVVIHIDKVQQHSCMDKDD